MGDLLKNFINYNIVMFKVGGLFTKLFMATIWPFCVFILFSPWGFDGSLVSQGGAAWVMVSFIVLFGLFFPIRNYLEVKKIVKGSMGNKELKDKYDKVLKEVEKTK